MRFRTSFATIVALSVCVPAAHAQVQADKDLVANFRSVVEKPSESVCRVRCNDKEVALGTVVRADGWILTKASELKDGKLTCEFKGGKTLDAVRKGTDEKFDLTLLKVDATDLKPVEWLSSDKMKPGYWAVSPGTGSKPVALGVVSTPARTVKGRGISPNPNSGFLGIGLDVDFAGVKITAAADGSPAAKGGLKPDDQIIAVNGDEVKDRDDFMDLMQRFKPGETLSFKLLRKEKEIELKITLGKRPPGTGDSQNSLGSALSTRRAGFPVVLQHDSIVKPTDCGGPVVDLKGRAFGINIARSGRTESLAIPSEEVQKLLPQLKETKKAEKDEATKP